MGSHIFSYFIAFLVGLSFLIACFATVDMPDGTPSRDFYNSFSFSFFAGVGVAIVLRFILFMLTLRYQKLWREHQETFSSTIAVPKDVPPIDQRKAALEGPRVFQEKSAEDAFSKAQQASLREKPQAVQHVFPRDVAETMRPPERVANHDVAIRVHEAVVKPLRWYPSLFILFVLPQILITITDNSVDDIEQQELARIILQIFVPFRGFALSLVFFANNRSFAHPRALKERLLARYSAFNLKQDKAQTLSEPLVPVCCFVFYD